MIYNLAGKLIIKIICAFSPKREESRYFLCALAHLLALTSSD
jgi:hypothetical protein